MSTQFFQINCKSVESTNEGVKIKGFASTPDIDRYDDIVEPAAFQKGLINFLKNPVMLRSHNADNVIGKFYTEGDDAPVVSDAGLSVTGLITDEEIGKKAINGEMRAMSIGFISKEVDWKEVGTGKFYEGNQLMRQVRIIKDLDLIEISIVSTPANPNALFSVEKSVKNYLQSLPNSIMNNKCSVYPELQAKFKLGDRYLSQKAVDEMELKGDEAESLQEVNEDVESVENTDTNESDTKKATENNENSGETPQDATVEETEQKVEEVESPATEQKKVAVESKGDVNLEKALEQVTSLVTVLADSIKKTNEEIATLKKAISETPVQKSKTLQVFTHTGLEKNINEEDKAFTQLFVNAKNSKVATL